MDWATRILKIPVTGCFLETYSLLPKTECQSGGDPEGSKVSFLASLKKLLVGTTAAASGLIGLIKERSRFNRGLTMIQPWFNYDSTIGG